MTAQTVQSALAELQAGLSQRAVDLAAGRAPIFGLDNIRAIANNLSVRLPEGVDTFVFYSGDYLRGSVQGDRPLGPTSSQAAKALAGQSNRVGIIDNTDLAKFLSSPELQLAAREIAGSEQAASAFLGGTDASNVRTSLWGQASERYAGTARGNVIVLSTTGTVDPNRIWAQVEFEAVLNNSLVERINGLDRASLLSSAQNADRSFAIDFARHQVELVHEAQLLEGGRLTRSKRRRRHILRRRIPSLEWRGLDRLFS